MLNNELRQRALERFHSGERNKILSRNNAKLIKGQKQGYLTTGIHLSPANLVSLKTVCSHSSRGCELACLNTSGQGQLHFKRKEGRFKGLNPVQESRALRTVWFELDKPSFMKKLYHELDLFLAKASRENLIPAVRLNLTSDIMWQTETTVMQDYPQVNFYGYTKVPAFKNIPSNYHVTFSRSENNSRYVVKAIEAGINVAVVFDELPDTYMGIPVIDGDIDDTRFNDPKGVIVGLKAKADAKKDKSGFVVRNSKCKDNINVLIDTLEAA